MSVAIATMGMASSVGGTKYTEIVTTGSSDGWWLRKKPVVVIRSIIEDDKYDKNKPAIEIIVEGE